MPRKGPDTFRPWRLPNGAKLGFIRSGVFWISRSVHGRLYRISTGCRTPDAALGEYSRFEADPSRYVPRGKVGTSWDASAKAFVRHSEQVTLNSTRWVDKQEAYLANFGAFTRGGSRVFASLDAFTASDVRAFIAELTEGKITSRKVGAASVNRHLATLKAFMGWARAEKQTSNLADTEIPMVREDKGSRFPTEIPAATWRAVLRELDERWRSAALVQLGAGLRYGEVAALTPDAIHAGAIFVSKAKGRKARTVPCSARAAAAARRLLELGGVPNDEAGQFNHRLEVACRAAGVARFTTHELRHTYASWSLRHGVDLRELQYRMGHASILTTERYLHVVGAGQRKRAVGAPV